MKNSVSILAGCVLLYFAICLTGCGLSRKVGNGFVTGAAQQSDSLSRKITADVIDEMTNQNSRTKVTAYLDSIVATLDKSLKPDVLGFEDSLLNHKVILWTDSLVEAVTGKKVQLNMKNLQYILVGKTKNDVLEMRNSFKTLLDEVLNTDPTGKLGKMRDELLGAKTDSDICRIVDDVTNRAINRSTTTLKEDASVIDKTSFVIISTLGVILLFTCIFFWWSRRRYIKLVTILSKQIHYTPDQHSYDLVTSKIKDEAITAGVEPSLRKILADNGLLENTNWNKKSQ